MNLPEKLNVRSAFFGHLQAQPFKRKDHSVSTKIVRIILVSSLES